MLRVTKLTDYATVVLTVLASDPDRVLSATELAERAGLETPTVAKVLKPLAQAGLIEVVEAMEGPLGMTECSIHAGHCTIEDHCGVRANWRRINDVVVQALRSVTLAQMQAPPAAAASPPPSDAKRIHLRLANT